MTKKDFKAAMLRGLGRCVKAVEQKPEKYRDIVLWACKRNISYDAQCEGTRSFYVYSLASLYSDKESFINAAADALKKYHSNSGWDLLHLSELLMFFAADGYDFARQAVENKYQELLENLKRRKRRPNRIFYELSDLEQLGLILAVDENSFLRVAEDFGSLYLEKKYIIDGDFSCFFESKGKEYKKAMERAAENNRAIACFLEREQASFLETERNREKQKKVMSEKMYGIRLSLWLRKNADRETIEKYARAYRDEKQPELRAEALEAFMACPYPGDPQIIINDAISECEKLRDAAWRALEKIRHPAVRSFALNNAKAENNTPENFALLATNYMPEDCGLAEALLRKLIKEKDWDGVHAVGNDIYRIFDNNEILPPKNLLPILYEYTPCSYCREAAVVSMLKYGMMTEEILEECLYDSNEDLRSRAEKC